MLDTGTLGVIGAGNMGRALVRGALAAQVVDASRVIASDRVPAALEALARGHGVRTTSDNGTLLADSHVVLLAIKPQGFDELVTAVGDRFRSDHLVISVLAGVPTRRIEDAIGLDLPVIRVMPNTPALVGQGMSAWCPGRFVSEAHGAVAQRLLASVGRAVAVREDQMDAITATSGSGPAYVFYLAEAMRDAAAKLGLDAALADTLVRQTILGAATLLADSDDPPEELRRRVTSRGGTTAAATAVFDDGDLAALVDRAVQAASARSEELGRLS